MQADPIDHYPACHGPTALFPAPVLGQPHYAMNTPTSIARSAPIAIASKNYRTRPGSGATESAGQNLSTSMSSTASADSLNTKNRKDRPCDACRRRKSKCVIHEGASSCALCQLHNQDCTFVHSPQPRKRKLNNENRENSDAKRRSPDRPDIRRRRGIESSISSGGASNSLIEDMANIGGPTLLNRTLGLQTDRYSQYIGPTTDFEPSLIDLSPFDLQDESLLSRGTLRKVSSVDTFLMLPDYTTQGHEHEIQDVDAVENLVAPHGSDLIELYFRIIHPNFPILQKSVFMEKYGRSHREFSPPLLAAIYILAINWWDHSEALHGIPRPDIPELERLARSTLADAMYRPKLSTVQAGLLLSQRPEGDQWAPTAQLVAIGQELGLHLDGSHWKIPPWERGLRKRLAWALYMQDKWGSLIHGRPSHIFHTNWAVLPLTANDFIDESIESESSDTAEAEQSRLLFTETIILSRILAEVLETFYTLTTMSCVSQAGVQGTNLILSLAKPVQLKLKEWFAALPVCLRMDSSTTKPNTEFSSIGFLHLAYFATEITLHRRIVRSLAPSSSSAGSQDPYITHICRSAAKTRLISAMDFVNRLMPSHLQSFWYFASKTNFALIGTFGSLLWATAPGREEAEFYRKRLEEYRWTLSVSARGAGRGGGRGLTEFAMGMLDISTSLLKSLPEKPVLTRSTGSRSDDSERVGAEVLSRLSTSSRNNAVSGFESRGELDEEGEDESGLASPSTSVSSDSMEGMAYQYEEGIFSGDRGGQGRY